MGFWPIPESYWPENTMNSLVFIILILFYFTEYILCITVLMINYSIIFNSHLDVLTQLLNFLVSTKNQW